MIEKIKSGISGLDTMLKSGIPKGREILLSGPCGSGKSTLAVQFVYHGAMNNEPGLYITLEERKETIYKDMEQMGFDLKKAEDSGKFFMYGGYITGLEKYMRKIRAKAHHLIDEIAEIIRQNKIQRVVVDSLTLLTMLSKDIEEKRNTVAALCNMLSGLGCTSLLISESDEGTKSISGHRFEEFVVDGVINLYQVRRGSQFIPGIAIRKMRGTAHDKDIRLYKITGKGVIVYPEETLFTDL